MVKSTLGSNLYIPTQLSLHSLIGKGRCEIQLEYVYWLGFQISFNNTSQKRQASVRGKKSGTQHYELGSVHKYVKRESHQKTDSSWGSDMGTCLKRTSQNKWSTYCWKMSSDRNQSQTSEFTAPFRTFLPHLLSPVSLHNEGFSILSMKYNTAIFAVINSTHAWQIETCKMFNIPVHRYFRDKIRLWIICHNK